MSAFYLYDPLSFLVQILLTYMLAHGIAPLSGANVAATFLNLLTRAAGGL